jgi:hypothetical protein
LRLCFLQKSFDTFQTKFEDVIAEVRARAKDGNIKTKPSNEPVKFSVKKPSEETSKEPVKPFYSKLQKTIDDKMPKAAFVQDIRGIINSAGIKPDEIKWSGIDTYLTSRIGSKVTKEELLDFLKMNELQIKEVTKGFKEKPTEEETEKIRMIILNNDYFGFDSVREAFRVIKKEIDFTENFESSPDDTKAIKEYQEKLNIGLDPKYKDYQLPGGQNYKEILFIIPNKTIEITDKAKEKELSDAIQEIQDAMMGRNTQDVVTKYNLTSQGELYKKQTDLRSELRSIQKITTQVRDEAYQSGHWDEPNVLAHTRFNDHTDEQGNKILFVEEIQSDWHQKGRKNGYIPTDINEQVPYGAVPNAPFAKTWHEFVIKRLIRYAAENGYDKIAWTTGEQQAERYNLSKQVGSVQVYRNYKDGKPSDSYQFFV